MGFTKATKKKARLRFAITGPAGSGKTYSALAMASAMGGRVAVIDTEHGSASKYADLFDFDTLELTTFAPANYVKAIQEAEGAGYEVIVVDSLSHGWMGKGGALEMVDKAARSSRSGNTYTAWADVTPEQNKLTEAILASKSHVFATMRSKMDYVLEADRNGKQAPRAVGLAPVQRDGIQYEFDVIGDLNLANVMTITKTRCPSLNGQSFDKPGADVAELLKAWLTDGADAPEKPAEADDSGIPGYSPMGAKLTDGLDSALVCTAEEIDNLRCRLGPYESDWLRTLKIEKLEDLTPDRLNKLHAHLDEQDAKRAAS